jgi:hypothetical protein
MRRKKVIVKKKNTVEEMYGGYKNVIVRRSGKRL